MNTSKEYRCGHCGRDISSNHGFAHGDTSWRILICHHCSKPTFLDDRSKTQFPGAIYGNEVKDVTDDLVIKLFDEARRAIGANCPTAAALCCRKLLMHVAVFKGAPENKTFQSYVQYLSDEHYIPPGAGEWVDLIREIGNEANHEIKIVSMEEGKQLLDLSEMLLRIIFEFPAIVQKRKVPAPAPPGAEVSSPKAITSGSR